MVNSVPNLTTEISRMTTMTKATRRSRISKIMSPTISKKRRLEPTDSDKSIYSIITTSVAQDVTPDLFNFQLEPHIKLN